MQPNVSRAPRRPPSWPPPQRLRDERLAWLAARAEAQRRSRPWWLTVLRLGAGARPSAHGFRRDNANRLGSHRLQCYGSAVDQLSRSLSAAERVTLRATGELPPWFWADLDEVAKAHRRRP